MTPGGQGHAEDAAPAGAAAIEFDGAAMGFDGPFDDGQPEAGPAPNRANGLYPLDRSDRITRARSSRGMPGPRSSISTITF